MLTFSERLAEVRRLLQERGEPTTDPQRRWVARLSNAEKLLLDAISLQEQVAAEPDNELTKKRLVIRQGQVRLALEQILRGVESHRRNYVDAHGASDAERRAGWNQAYADRIMKTEGRVVRTNKKRSEMTPEEWAAHRRKQEREAKAKQRSKKSSENS